MEDKFRDHPPGLDSPLYDLFEVQASENELQEVPRALLSDAAGEVTVVTMRGNEVVVPIQPGVNPIRVLKVTAISEGITRLVGGV